MSGPMNPPFLFHKGSIHIGQIIYSIMHQFTAMKDMVCISDYLHATSAGIQECREKKSAPIQEIPVCLKLVKGLGDVLGK